MKINQSYLFGGVVLILAVSTMNSLLIFSNENSDKTPNKAVDSNSYQAVFLSNNQIYFGHVKSSSSDFLTLTDVYYIQINDADQTQNRLVRLGDSEPHGPRNEMIINKTHILFMENLSPNSKVVQAIQSIQSRNK